MFQLLGEGGFYMLNDYVKTPKEVYVHDDKLGTYTIDYQDNIDKVMDVKHDIDILEAKLKENKNYIYNLKFMKFELFLPLIIILTAAGIINIPVLLGPSLVGINLTRLLIVESVLGLLLFGTVGHFFKKSKHIKKAIADMNIMATYLEEEINNKKEILEELEKDKTANLRPEVELVTLSDSLKKQLLEKKLEILVFYKNSIEQGKSEEEILSSVPDLESKEFVRTLTKKN